MAGYKLVVGQLSRLEETFSVATMMAIFMLQDTQSGLLDCDRSQDMETSTLVF